MPREVHQIAAEQVISKVGYSFLFLKSDLMSSAFHHAQVGDRTSLRCLARSSRTSSGTGKKVIGRRLVVCNHEGLTTCAAKVS